MMEAVYAVLLHGKHVGAIHRRDAFTKFVFDRDYWDRPNRAVLGGWCCRTTTNAGGHVDRGAP